MSSAEEIIKIDCWWSQIKVEMIKIKVVNTEYSNCAIIVTIISCCNLLIMTIIILTFIQKQYH